jgi:PAS domain S-box-containing protein
MANNMNPQMVTGDPDGGDLLTMMNMPMFDSLNGFDPMAINMDDTDEITLPQSFQSAIESPVDKESALAASGGRHFSNADENMMDGSGGLGQLSQSNLPGSSTLTEFTKRRNWPAKVVEELRDLVTILDANGKIKYVSPNLKELTGYTNEDILNTFLRNLIHPDDVGVFVSDLNESIASGTPLRTFYRFKKKDDTFAIFESIGHAHIATAKFAPNPQNQSPFCQAVFMMSRPYPTKNAGLLDSFLEHKIENERLKRRISELRKEEEADNDESQRQWLQSQEGRSDVTLSEDNTPSAAVATAATFQGNMANSTMGPPERPAPLNTALTRENLEGAVAGSRPDSLRDKMARYEGTSHADTIEMLTGLRYIEGERSLGISTGNASPALIKGDAGIAIPMDRDPRTGEKNKKKLKTSEEYVCTDCGKFIESQNQTARNLDPVPNSYIIPTGTLDSPEWRKGPSGPKTLCNACGLRWAKKEKKRTNPGANTGGSSFPMVDSSMG